MTDYFSEIIESEEALNRCLGDRRRQLNIPQDELEHTVGLTQGHVGKIEHGGKTWGKMVIRWSPTLNWMLEALGLALVIMDRETAAKLCGDQLRHYDRSHIRKTDKMVHPVKKRMIMKLSRQPDLD
jgi:transcriptional regulator with XRE-family HTH domain